MRILLVQPPIKHSIHDAYRTEGLGIAYIASALRQKGHEVSLIDAHMQGLDLRRMITEILSRNFDALGITAANAHRKALMEIAKAVKSAKPDAIVCAGGYLPSLAHDRLLKACPHLDFVVRGEGELVAVEVFGRIADGKEWRDVAGVAFRDGDEIVANQAPPLIKDLDSLPFPARDALKDSAFPIQSAGVCGARGCYSSCSFCCLRSFNKINGSRIPRFRSPENIMAEIEQVVKEVGVKQIRFVDDDFIGPGPKMRARVLALADLLRKSNLGITFKIECRADEVDADVLLPLKEAGLAEIYLGVESGIQRALDTFNKGVTVEQNKKAIELVRSLGIKLRCGFIMFDPYLTTQELQENVQFIKEMGIDKEAADGPAPLVTRLNIFHGVPLIDKLKEDGLLVDDGFDYDYKHKNPEVGLMFKASMACAACSSAVKRVKSVFSGKRKG
ncbi:MAG: radical SAM protein [Armatimonadota bacterium]|nr:radical SAM protein [Armatimonadota bacterium]